MSAPTLEFMHGANKLLHTTLQELRPTLLKAHGSIEHSLKDDKSVVTEMDVMVEHRLHEVLGALDESIGLSGEETGVDYTKETFWLVDPIDGTESFVRGLPFSTNMITLIHDGEPIMSVIYNFFTDEYFHAIRGQGATMNGHPIHVSDRPLNRAYVIFGTKVKNPKLIGISDRLRRKVYGMPKAAAAGFELTSIARGAFEGSLIFDSSAKPWDFAPGALIIQEAGGRVENLDSTTYDFRDTQVIMATPTVFDDLKKFLKDEIAAAS